MVLARARGLDHPHHVLGRKHHRRVDIEFLALRLDQIDRGSGGAMLGVPVHGIDQVLVEEILRGN